jgi:hypothetical protein
MLSFVLLLASNLGNAQPHQKPPSTAQVVEGSSKAGNNNVADVSENTDLATRLVQKFFTYLSATGSPTGEIGKPSTDDTKERNKVKTLLDQEVIIQRADGDIFDYSSYYPIDIDKFTISNMKTTRPRHNLLVAAYDVSTPGATSLTRGFVNSSDAMPRLTTFRYNQETKSWLILSHASFNQPILQICEHPPIRTTRNVKKNHGNPSMKSQAYTLIERLYTEVRSRGKASAHKGGLITGQTQIMSGDGYKRTGALGARSVKVGTTQKRDFMITGSNNDLVVRYDAKNNSHIGGVEFTDEWQPRLATFSRNDSGQWELASYALFNYPASPPAGTKCIKTQK